MNIPGPPSKDELSAGDRLFVRIPARNARV